MDRWSRHLRNKQLEKDPSVCLVYFALLCDICYSRDQVVLEANGMSPGSAREAFVMVSRKRSNQRGAMIGKTD